MNNSFWKPMLSFSLPVLITVSGCSNEKLLGNDFSFEVLPQEPISLQDRKRGESISIPSECIGTKKVEVGVERYKGKDRIEYAEEPLCNYVKISPSVTFKDKVILDHSEVVNFPLISVAGTGTVNNRSVNYFINPKFEKYHQEKIRDYIVNAYDLERFNSQVKETVITKIEETQFNDSFSLQARRLKNQYLNIRTVDGVKIIEENIDGRISRVESKTIEENIPAIQGKENQYSNKITISLPQEIELDINGDKYNLTLKD